MNKVVHIIDYGSGNLYSVCRAVETCGGKPVLVERPDGHPARRVGPLKNGTSLLWKTIARNKRVVRHEAGDEAALDALLAEADVVTLTGTGVSSTTTVPSTNSPGRSSPFGLGTTARARVVCVLSVPDGET